MDVMEKDVDSRERVTVRIGSWFTTSSRVGDALLVAWLLRFGKLYSIVLSHVSSKVRDTPLWRYTVSEEKKVSTATLRTYIFKEKSFLVIKVMLRVQQCIL